MANLPSNRTKLNVAVANQQPSIVASSQANREAMVEAYDTIDLLNQKVDGLVAGSLLVPFPPADMSRQALINGNFDIWQRGASFLAANGYTADRWRLQAASGATVNVTRQAFAVGQTAVPLNPTNFAQIEISAAGSASSYFYQNIEDVRSFAGSNVTLSFWARCTSGTYNLNSRLFQNFGTGGSAGISWSKPQTVNTSWTKFVYKVALGSLSGKTIGTNNYLQLVFDLLNTSGANTIQIAQIQLCAGDMDLPFQPKTYDQELRDCLRYFEVIGGENTMNVATGVAVSATQALIPITFSPKRIAPTVINPTIIAANCVLREAAIRTVTSFDAVTQRDTSHALLTTNATGLTAGYAAILRFQDNTAFITIDAEL